MGGETIIEVMAYRKRDAIWPLPGARCDDLRLDRHANGHS